MAARRESLELTNRYRRLLLQLRQAVVRAARASWRPDYRDVDSSYREWLVATGLVVTAAQREGVSLTNTYLGMYLASELATETIGPEVDPGEYAGRSRDGRDIREALTPPLYTLKLALGQGRAPSEASGMALNRAVRIVSVEAVQAPRDALQELLRNEDRILGWRRATSANPCGGCLAAATGETHRPDVSLLVHPHCRCTIEPVVAGINETVARPTGRQLFDRMTEDQQDRLFAGRGGAEKADLVRSGQFPLSALITRNSQVTGDDVITETPLAALTT